MATFLVAVIPFVYKLNLMGTAFGLMETLESFAKYLIITGERLGAAQTPAIGYRISTTIFW
jgi:hypothetical protein